MPNFNCQPAPPFGATDTTSFVRGDNEGVSAHVFLRADDREDATCDEVEAQIRGHGVNRLQLEIMGGLIVGRAKFAFHRSDVSDRFELGATWLALPDPP